MKSELYAEEANFGLYENVESLFGPYRFLAR